MTWLLWFSSFLLLGGGVAILMMKLARRRPSGDALPDAEMQRAAALLGASTDTKETA